MTAAGMMRGALRGEAEAASKATSGRALVDHLKLQTVF